MPEITGQYENKAWRMRVNFQENLHGVVIESVNQFGDTHRVRTIGLSDLMDDSLPRLERRVGESIATLRLIATDGSPGGSIMVAFRDLPSVSQARIKRAVVEEIPGVDYNDACQCRDCRGTRSDFDYDEALHTCANCGDPDGYNGAVEDRDAVGLSSDGTMVLVCDGCWSDNAAFCVDCERYIWVPSQPYYWDDEVCSDCYGEEAIRSWDYRPLLEFHPLPPENGALYIGMELEVSFSNQSRGRRWARDFIPGYEGLLYAKADSSVRNGYEVVTHPMQPEWAMQNFPFEIFQQGIENYGMRLTHESTGTHIHMNKESFTSAHLWKFLQIHDKLSHFCGVVGGRGTSAGYGSFDRYGGDANFLGVDRARLLEIAKKKGKFDNPERYVAVNLRNEYTLELRYMRGGVAPKEIKKNIQWAQALYEFSDYIDLRDVREGALSNPGYLLWWIGENRERFPHLYDWVQKEIPQPLALRERS